MGSVNQVSGNVVTVQRYLWLDFAVKHVRTRSLLITQYNHSFSETEWVKWCIQMFLKKKKKKEMFLIGSSWQLTITNWQHCSYKLNMESLHVLISRYSGKLNMLGLFAIEISALQGSELWDGSEHWPGWKQSQHYWKQDVFSSVGAERQREQRTLMTHKFMHLSNSQKEQNFHV